MGQIMMRGGWCMYRDDNVFKGLITLDAFVLQKIMKSYQKEIQFCEVCIYQGILQFLQPL